MHLFGLAVLLASIGGDFQSSLQIRDFQRAFELAGDSDSLNAVVFRRSGDHLAAAALFQRAFDRKPSAGLFCDLWEEIASFSEQSVSPPAVDPGTEFEKWNTRLSWSAGDLLSLVETSNLLEDSALSRSLVLLLTDRFPGSLQSSQVISREFYEDLYPVWYDDSARVAVLAEFLDKWGDRSELWRSRAWQYTLAAVTETADSLQWRSCLYQWQEACPDDPFVCLAGAALCIDRDSSWSEALEFAEHGLILMDAGWFPQEMPESEWAVTGAALEAGLQFRKLFAEAGSGCSQRVLEELSGVIAVTGFDPDDYHTKSSFYWLQGKLFLAEEDTVSALSSFAMSAIAGDAKNRWSGYAESSMDSLLPCNVSPVQWAREYRGYRGPVFKEANEIISPDSFACGSRVSWCDWNSDGYPDIYTGHTLLQNENGVSFSDVTCEAGLDSCRGNGGVWSDLDNNGTQDLVTAGNPVQVFLNTEGILEDFTDVAGIQATGAAVEGVALVDWNADGWLDVYLASYEGGQGAGTADAFYLGGENGFTRAGDSLGMVPFLGKPLCGRGVSPCDYDLDGDMDIFVSNYRLQENFLWKNENGTAINAALTAGVAGVDVDGWWGHTIGSAWGDYDNDGDWDLFSANLAHPRYMEFSDRSMLLQNTGNGFTDVRAESGIRFEETMSNPVWGDFNNDGLLDMFVTSIYQDRRSFLYLNTGNGRFEDVTWLSGARVFNGWGAAAGDFDIDGRLDLAVGSSDGFTLLGNTTQGGNWLLVRVNPPEGVNRSGIGCTVKVEQNGVTVMRQVEGGSGTTSQNSRVLHFGLRSDSSTVVRLYLPGEVDPFATAAAEPGGVLRLLNCWNGRIVN